MAALLSPLPPAHPVSINDIDRSPNAAESFQVEMRNTHVSYGLPCLSTGLDLPKVGRISGFQFVRLPFLRGEQTSIKERRDEHALNHNQGRENPRFIKQIKSKPSLAKMVLHQYTYIFVIGTFFALLDAFNNGASECRWSSYSIDQSAYRFPVFFLQTMSPTRGPPVSPRDPSLTDRPWSSEQSSRC